MKLIQKRYKVEKLQNILQKQFFFFQTGNLSEKNLVELRKNSIETNKAQNNLIKKLLKKEDYKIINNFIQGSLILGYSKNLNYLKENLINPIKNLTFLSLKLNSNFYNKKEVESNFYSYFVYNINLLNELNKNSKVLCHYFKKLYVI